jgi:hypothetical protein
MGNRVSKCLRQETVHQTGQLDPYETPRGNHLVRVTPVARQLLTSEDKKRHHSAPPHPGMVYVL